MSARLLVIGVPAKYLGVTSVGVMVFRPEVKRTIMVADENTSLIARFG
jgi:hypothetical protein